MIQIISGAKGKGKTKVLLEMVNADIRQAKGNIVYLDKNTKHMYELSNRVRLINVTEYCIENSYEFNGFICGIISQDHDLEKVYLDSFLSIACLKDSDIPGIIAKLDSISKKFKVDFIISISVNKDDLPDGVRDMVVVSL